MLTVVTTATSTRLTTLARARELLGFSSADDAAAERCIDQASRAIVDHCRRPFGLETVREAFTGPDPGDGILLGRSPVVAILSAASDGAALPTTEYDHDASTGRLHRIDGYGRRFRWWWGSALVVEYQTGYVLPGDMGTVTLPDPVERAAILITGAYLSVRGRDPLVRSESVEGIGSTSWWVPGPSGMISTEAEQLLQPYRRIW